MRIRKAVEGTVRLVTSLIGIQELLLVVGLGLFTYGRYLENPARAYTEVGIMLIVLGIANHLPSWAVRFRTRGKP